MQAELGRLAETLNAQVLVGEEDNYPNIESAYFGSEFAELLEADIFNTLLVTNVDSSEVLRVVAETDVIAILYTNGQKPKQTEMKKAEDMGLTVLLTDLSLKRVHSMIKELEPELNLAGII